MYDDWATSSCTPCDILNVLRAEGWAVAVHNDYRQDGKPMTFWLFTKDGRAVKGEGPNDVTALTIVKEQIEATNTSEAKHDTMTTLRKSSRNSRTEEPAHEKVEDHIVTEPTKAVAPAHVLLERWASKIASEEFPDASLGQIERTFGIRDITLTIREATGRWLLEVGTARDDTSRFFRVRREYDRSC